VARCERYGANLGASRLYLPGRLEASTSQVNSSAPLGFVARGIEWSTIAVAMRFWKRPKSVEAVVTRKPQCILTLWNDEVK
jgi:hypothetical protein